MKLNAIKFYTTLFVMVLFLQLYLPSFKANIFIQIVVLFLFLGLEKPKIPKDYLKIIVPLASLFFIGFLGTVLNRYTTVAILKDIFHFSKPFLGISIGYFFYKRINNFKLFIKTIVLVGFVSAIIHFCLLLFFSKVTTVSGIREFGKDNFLELFALFFLAYYKKFQKESLFIHRSNYTLVLCVLLVSCVLYLSRTMMISSVIALLSIYGYTIITKMTLKVFLVLLLSIIGLYVYLFSVNIQRDKPGLEAFLYKIKIAPAELFQTNINRENHKDLWDHWRGYEAKRAFALMNDNLSSYVFGNGHGSLVNLKFYAPLTGEKKGLKFISELHNGYVYILYKTGIIGLSIYLLFLVGLYKTIYHKRNIFTIYISGIGLIFLFTTLTITGIYNASDTIVFILGAMLFFNHDLNSKKMELNDKITISKNAR